MNAAISCRGPRIIRKVVSPAAPNGNTAGRQFTDLVVKQTPNRNVVVVYSLVDGECLPAYDEGGVANGRGEIWRYRIADRAVARARATRGDRQQTGGAFSYPAARPD